MEDNVTADDNVTAYDIFDKFNYDWVSEREINQAIDAYVAQGGDINARDDSNCTFLHQAVEHNYVDVLDHLLSLENIDVNTQAIGGNTPLHYEVTKGDSEIVTKLLDHPDIDTNITNDNKKTAFAIAFDNKNGEIITLFTEFYDNTNNQSTRVGYLPRIKEEPNHGPNSPGSEL